MGSGLRAPMISATRIRKSFVAGMPDIRARTPTLYETPQCGADSHAVNVTPVTCNRTKRGYPAHLSKGAVVEPGGDMATEQVITPGAPMFVASPCSAPMANDSPSLRRSALSLVRGLVPHVVEHAAVYGSEDERGWALLAAASADTVPRPLLPERARLDGVLPDLIKPDAAEAVVQQLAGQDAVRDAAAIHDLIPTGWNCCCEWLQAVPISSEGHVAGVVLVANRARPRREAEALFRSVSAVGIDAIAATLTYVAQRVSNQRLLQMKVVTEALASCTKVADVAARVVEHALEAVGASGGVVMLLDRTGTTLEVVHAAGAHIAVSVDAVAHSAMTSVYRPSPTRGEGLESGFAPYDKISPGPDAERELILPLVLEGRFIGVFALRFNALRPMTRDDFTLLEEMARQAALFIERCQRFKDETAARWRTASLQRVTASLASARSLEQVATRVVESLADALECPAVWLTVLSPDRATPVIIEASGVCTSVVTSALSSSDTAALMQDLLADRRPRFFADHASFAAALGDAADRIGGGACEAAAMIPVCSGRRVLATLGLRFRGRSAFDEELRTFLAAVVLEAAHALERALLQEAERRARQNLTFLLDANRLLSASWDLDDILRQVGELVVSHLADWCAVDTVTSDGGLQSRVMVNRDPGLVARAVELRCRLPLSCEAWLLDVVRRARGATLVRNDASAVSDAHSDAHSDELRAELRDLGFHSCMVLPLAANGRVQGVMTLAVGSGREYGAEDLALAEELAARAAVAVEKARQHQELVHAREDAERANRVKDEFVAMLGHELRNPLMPILTVVELMRLQGDHAHTREWSVVERQGRHLLRLVDDLLDVARITRGKVKIRCRPVDALQIVTRALETASPELERRRHEVTVECARSDLWIDGDEDRLVQVVANLLNNAALYTEPGGRIHVQVQGETDAVVLRVSDTGAGMSEAMLARVFDIFVQGPRPIDRAQGGLGLGLAIVKNIVELHGGTVSATSAGAGRGSIFAVRLPRTAAPVTAPARDTPERFPAAGVKHRVLVVDDNIDAAETLADALRLHGHDVRVAYDGPAALTVLSTFEPHVALLDIGLPVMDGYALAGELRAAIGGRLLLVAITGYGQPSDVARAREAGFHHHFTKPVDMDGLIALLDGTGVHGVHHGVLSAN